MSKYKFLVGLLCALGAVSFANSPKESQFEWDGSRIPPVHRFPMFDEFGQQVVPAFDHALPFSSRNTCGTCHNYSTVAQGWHFNSSKGTGPNGRPGEPWVWVDEATGTWLPLSYRKWPGTHHPAEVGMTEWRFTQIFGRHMPGGDMGEPVDDLKDPESRWDLSGKIEINCLACHNDSHEQDLSEWAKQVARENFRWAATAASGYGEVNGMASRVRSSWTIFDGPNKDDTEFAVAPSVNYNENKFDSKNRTVFNVVHQPPDRNCLQCHSVTQAHATRVQVDGDVHSLMGLKCADCHRNDLSHKMVRGFEGEEKLAGMAHAGDFSCRGCHVGAENGSMQTMKSGRLGAPKPVHAGIPPVHFEKMACTTCHSGPMPDAKLTEVRTSRIHRIGIHGRAEWFTEQPTVVEPVFVKNEEGIIEPRRMMWPAFFGRLKGDKVEPLTPDDVKDATAGVLDAQQQIARVLNALALSDQETTGYPVLISGGKILRRSFEGKLSAETFEGTPTLEGSWAWFVEAGNIQPLVPSLDPETGELTADGEAVVTRRLDALAQNSESTRPALLLAGKLHRVALDGTLEKTDHTDQASSVPQWVVSHGEALTPLVAPETIQAAAQIVGSEAWFTESQILQVLNRLAQAGDTAAGSGEYVYVSSGKLFRKSSDGKLTASDHEAAAPVSWAIAHDVRPAAQSLGATSCAECHAADSPYFHATVSAPGPLMTLAAASAPMHRFQERDGSYERLFGYSFTVREYFKKFLFASSGALGLVICAYALVGVRRVARFVGTKDLNNE